MATRQTNVMLNVDYARLEKLTFSLELNASASNSLSIAIGAAAGDALTLDEADFDWGYDCGKWFRADTETSADRCIQLNAEWHCWHETKIFGIIRADGKRGAYKW